MGPEGLAALRRWAERQPLECFVLHGSRAKNTAQPNSDWDFAYIADAGFNPLRATLELEDLLGMKVDLADLERAGAVLRYTVARDGQLIYERSAGTFEAFRLAAIAFWCDAGVIIRCSHDELLEGLG